MAPWNTTGATCICRPAPGEEHLPGCPAGPHPIDPRVSIDGILDATTIVRRVDALLEGVADTRMRLRRLRVAAYLVTAHVRPKGDGGSDPGGAG